MGNKTLRVVMISDTHEQHEKLDGILPDGDVLIHAGDATLMGEIKAVEKFVLWFTQQKHQYKVFVPGNHDFFFEKHTDLFYQEGFLSNTDIHLLINRAVMIEGLKFYGAPQTLKYGDWAFMQHENQLIETYKDIPDDTDVLVSHGPMFGILDSPAFGKFKSGAQNAGSHALLKRVQEVKPTLVVHGHIHEARGMQPLYHNSYKKVTAVVNASFLTRAHTPYIQSPFVLDIKTEHGVYLV